MRHALQPILSSLAARGLLAASVPLILALVLRPTVVLAPVLLVSTLLYVVCFDRATHARQILADAIRTTWPLFAFFLVAALVAIPTSFNATNHLTLIPKILLLQVAVVALYCLGRCVGTVDTRSLCNWIFGIVVASTLVVLVEEYWFPLHSLAGVGGVLTPEMGWLLNRSVVLLTLCLMFFLLAGRDLGRHVYSIGSIVLLITVFMTTSSETAQLLVVIAVGVYFLPINRMEQLLTVAVAVAIVLIVVGPFLYDPIMKAWEAGPLGDFRKGTIHARLVIWAEYSSLITDSNFLGRGLNSSKQLIFDKSLYQMPYNFYGWHPHNAGLEIVTDLGFFGGIWLSVIFIKLRSFVFALRGWYQRALISVFIGILAISYVADGLWQSWWWLALALLAMFVAILANNRVMDENTATVATNPAEHSAVAREGEPSQA